MTNTQQSTKNAFPNMRENYQQLGNRQKYIDIFIKFFGEENREKVETFITHSIILLLPQRIEAYRFGQFIAKTCPDLSIENANTLIEYFTNVPTYIQQKRWGELCYEPILKHLGLNRNELLHFNKSTNKEEWNPLAIAKKHKLSKFLKEIVTSINIDELEDMKQTEKENKDNKSMPATYISQFKAECAQNGITLDPDYNSNVWIKELLENKLPDPEDDFFVKDKYKVTFNCMFSTNFSSWDELVEDNRFKNCILPLIKKYNSKFSTVNRQSKATKQAYSELSEILSTKIPDEQAREDLFKKANEYFENNPNAGAYQSSRLSGHTPGIILPLNNRTTLHDIIHEFLHLLSISLKTRQAFIINEKSKNGKNATGFTEYATEYLTKKLIEEFTKKGFKDLEEFPIPLSRPNVNCSYDNGVELFKPFLDAYYQDLKKCFMTNENPLMILQEKMGEEELDNMIDLTSDYFECKEQNYLKALSLKLGKVLNSAKDVLKYQNQLQNLELNELERKYLNTVVESQLLCEKLLERKTGKNFNQQAGIPSV